MASRSRDGTRTDQTSAGDDMTPIERFEKKYIPEPNTGCWLWIGHCKSNGYGQAGSRKTDDRFAHRESWRLHKGPIPNGLHVLHRCDVRCCVNPDHLFLGTPTDNMKDCSAKGRTARGEIHGCAKLTEDQILEIRKAPNTGHGTLAAAYGVTPSNITAIKRGISWKHLG